MFFGRITIVVACMLALFCVSITHAQVTIGGVVNRYVPVLKVIPCDSTVQVGNAKGFSSGDLVFIIQMKGAKVLNTKDSTSGFLVDIKSAGSAEFLTIGSVNGDRITFTTRLANTYDPTGIVQLIYVPKYTNARVASTLTCEQWNGTIGGVLVIDVEKDLSLDADISVDGLGFAGGSVSSNLQTTEVSDWNAPWVQGLGGEKGESIAAIPGFLPMSCRGRWANGGGGGNGANAGGGGGSNGGSGGNGGNPLKYNVLYPTVHGEPGVSLDAVIANQGRLFMGGGGGGGHQNDTLGTNGGNGGGIIVIRAGRLLPQGQHISANGNTSLSCRPSQVGDGTGGGGAGGTIVLDIKRITSIANVYAMGGNSGNIPAQWNAHGPGGGGSGGAILLSRPTPNLNVVVTGGTPGVHTNPQNGDYLLSWGAQPGEPGIVLDTFSWNTPISIGLDAWGGGPFCGTQSVDLHATPGFASYLWSNGATTANTVVNTLGDYTVTAVDPSGCVHTAGPVHAWENSPQYSLATAVDFGTVDYKRKYIRIVPLVNNDDEDIVVSKITSAPNIIIVSPISYPVVIPAGQSIDIAIQLFTADIQDYHEVLSVYISSPCPDTGYITVDAIINLVHAHYTVPDTTAPVGATGYGIPIRVRVSPDTLILPATHLLLKLHFDSRIFTPTMLTRGKIIGDVIDVIANTRTLTIEFDSINIVGPEMTMTTIVGTVLNSYVTQCALDIVSVEYIEVFQNPIDTITDGSLVVSPVCFQRGRQIIVYGKTSAHVTPNPAREVASVNMDMSAPGTYTLVITDVTGSVMDTHTFTKSDSASETRTVDINLARWPSGIYGVTFTTVLGTTRTSFVVDR